MDTIMTHSTFDKNTPLLCRDAFPSKEMSLFEGEGDLSMINSACNNRLYQTPLDNSFIFQNQCSSQELTA